MATTRWTPPEDSIFAMRDEAVEHLTDAELVRLIQTAEDALSWAKREGRMGDVRTYADTLAHLQSEEADRQETRYLQRRAQVVLPFTAYTGV